ncbi:hypothetical protein DAEQUDRAFT_769322 [Daedalea quercina L-15889]|uniref:Uncharacterized protein n=1 Tax=Daedalea quercina L-15889 TaxID=1314783 RepID=A0A165LVE1_9APHY|nr:hypothetical protein DAEQUDRAFT_769322 [Daedalea quercina L-15889]
MRFTNFFSLALAAAAASVAVARPVYDSVLTVRAEDDMSLSAHELAILDLLSREYIADADFGLSRRGDTDIVDLLAREYLATALLARAHVEQQRGQKTPQGQPLKSAMKGKGGAASQSQGANRHPAVGFVPTVQVMNYKQDSPPSNKPFFGVKKL